VSNVDLVPTLAALAKVEWPRVLPGRDLSAARRGAAEADGGAMEEAVFAEVSIPWTRVRAERVEKLTRMVRTRDWKYVLYPSGAEELYHTAADPYELRNLAGAVEHGAQRDEMRRRLETFLKTTL
jgi:arylsulfatase A-like enzyme